MAIRPLKVINPSARKSRAPAKRAPRKTPRKTNPKTRTVYRRMALKARDDVMHSVAAGAGGVVSAFIDDKVSGWMPEDSRMKEWSALMVALGNVALMVFLGRRNPTLRAVALGGVGACAGRLATAQGLVKPQPVAAKPLFSPGRMGQVPTAQRIASILGTGPGRSEMGYLSEGGPAIRTDANIPSMGYLSEGGPYVNETTEIY